MAAPTVTFDQRKAMPFLGGTLPWGIITGTVAITSYDNTHPAVTAITGKFKGAPKVMIGSPGGWLVVWDPATSSFKAFETGAALSGVFAEAANATNVGTANFVAIGQLG